MPKIEIKAKELNDVKIIKNMQKIKNTIENKSTTISDKSSQQCFVIEFNENGSPIDCHKVNKLSHNNSYVYFIFFSL